MESTFQDKFQVKKIFTESQDMRTKYIRDSDWKNPDGRYKSESLKKIKEKVKYQKKHKNASQNTRVFLIRLSSD